MLLNAINVGFEDTTAVDLYYEDIGEGKPVILIHGWPIDSSLWINQTDAFRNAGFRVISYDRRGYGKSSRPSNGYDYDTLADDLHKIISTLDLHDITLIGFSTGCGEIFRYLGTYGSERIIKAVFVNPLSPSPHKSSPDSAFDLEKFRQTRIMESMEFIHDSTHGFLSDIKSGKKRNDEKFLELISQVIHSISLTTKVGSASSWQVDFADDLRRIAIPTLVIHGDTDYVTSISISSKTLASLLVNSRLTAIKDGSICLPWTNPEQLNKCLIEFIKT